MTAPRNRLVHHVPLRLRHHWKPAGFLAVGLSALLIFFGDVRVTPFVTSASTADGDEITEDVTGSVDRPRWRPGRPSWTGRRWAGPVGRTAAGSRLPRAAARKVRAAAEGEA